MSKVKIIVKETGEVVEFDKKIIEESGVSGEKYEVDFEGNYPIMLVNESDVTKLIKKGTVLDEEFEPFMPKSELDSMLENYKKAKLAEEAAVEEQDKLKAVINEELNKRGCNKLVGTLFKASRTVVTSERLDTKKLKEEKPKIWEAYKTESVSSRLTVR